MQPDILPANASEFHARLIIRAVPEMMDLATRELAALSELPDEITPAALVAMVMEDALPLMGEELGIPRAALLLQCALLEQLELLALLEAEPRPPTLALAS